MPHRIRKRARPLRVGDGCHVRRSTVRKRRPQPAMRDRTTGPLFPPDLRDLGSPPDFKKTAKPSGAGYDHPGRGVNAWKSLGPLRFRGRSCAYAVSVTPDGTTDCCAAVRDCTILIAMSRCLG